MLIFEQIRLMTACIFWLVGTGSITFWRLMGANGPIEKAVNVRDCLTRQVSCAVACYYELPSRQQSLCVIHSQFQGNIEALTACLTLLRMQ